MGFGVPAAIGAKLARPDREVWAIVGDGGFQMTQAELQTIAQEGVKITIAIITAHSSIGKIRRCVPRNRHAASASPSPAPSYWRARLASSWMKGWNKRGRLAAAMPIPVSLTVNSKQLSALLRSETGQNTVLQIRLPGGEQSAMVKERSYANPWVLLSSEASY